MKNGSDPNVENKYGLSALDKAGQNPNIKQFLEKYNEAKRNFPRFKVKL